MNRYNQAPHLTQDTNGKVTTSQLDITANLSCFMIFHIFKYKHKVAGDIKSNFAC